MKRYTVYYIVFVICLTVGVLAANIRVYTWQRPETVAASPHLFLGADWARCVWLGDDTILWCDSGE